MSEQAQFTGGGVRDSDEGKPRFDLLWPKDIPYKEQPIYKLAMHLTEGAKRYEERNWELFHDAQALDRAMQSKMRHHSQDVAGERDEAHNIAEMANCLFVETIRYKVRTGWKPLAEGKPESTGDFWAPPEQCRANFWGGEHCVRDAGHQDAHRARAGWLWSGTGEDAEMQGD